MLYRCTHDPSHGLTDQRSWVGCRKCWIERNAANATRFFDAHLHQPGSAWTPFRSEFTYDQIRSTFTFSDPGGTVAISSPPEWLDYVTLPSRCSWRWNSKHNTPNLWVPEVGWGATGSGTTSPRSAPSDYTGILVANALADPHAYPINPSGYATADLIPYIWRCACGSMAPPTKASCMACEQGISSGT